MYSVFHCNVEVDFMISKFKGFILLFASGFLKVFDWLFIKIQKADKENLAQPIFIIGAPRTGSTILYQALSNAYEVAFIDNIACKWHKNLGFGMWLSNKKFGNLPHNNFESDHGNTLKFGSHAPSECGAFWYRWLPKERHFIDDCDLTSKMVKQIRTEVLSISAYLNKPFLFKNLNAGQRLRLIRQTFPNAKFIFIRRDPRFVISSILKARKKAGIKETDWWSIMPPNVKELMGLPETEMCAAQVYFLEKQIEEDLALFPSENIREVHYQNFSESLIHELGEWIGAGRRSGAKLPNFRSDSPCKLASDEEQQFNQLTKKYPFRQDLLV